MSNQKLKILAISGSTRQTSSNLLLIHAIAALAAEVFDLRIFEGLSDLPHFNPDLDHEHPARQVVEWRKQLDDADGVLICTPEYAVGVPGTLKNAIDWTVSSMQFSGKPVALITASTSGYAAHQSLLGTLLIIESRITKVTQLVIPAIRAKLTEDGGIKDEDTQASVRRLIGSLTASIKGIPQDYLPAPEFFITGS